MAIERANSFTVLSDAIFIAMLTTGAYWFTFCYEAAYVTKFGVPLHLIEISLQATLTLAAALWASILGFLMMVNFLALFWPEHPAIRAKVFRVVAMLLVPFFYVLHHGFRTEDWLIYVVAFVFVGIFEFMWPVFVYHGRPLRERFIADEDAEAPIRARGLFGRIQVAFGPVGSNVLFFLLMGTFIANMAGRISADGQTEYLLLINVEDLAVVRIYHDTIIAVPFDRKTKTIQPQLVIRKIGTDGVILTRDQSVGPLKKQMSKGT